MSVSIVASYVACLGVVSSGAPATISFNATGSTFLVVAYGWQSCNPYVAPSIAFNGEMMSLNATHAYEDVQGTVSIWTLPLFSPGTSNLVIQPTGFLGNSQIAIYAFTGTNQTLGTVAQAEYGTNAGATNTGTTNISSVTSGSMTAAVGMTFFGGTPSSIPADTGWTATNHATASNESVFAFTSTTSGNISITMTDGASSFWTMLMVAFEVKSGSPPSGGSGVQLMANASGNLGNLNTGILGTMSFAATSDTDLIVAVLGFAPFLSFWTPPSITYNGETMQYVTSPVNEMGVEHSGGVAGCGIMALYVLVPTAPDNSSHSVVVNSAPNFAGHTGIHIAAYKNTNHNVSLTVTDIYGNPDSRVAGGTTAMNSIAVGSSICMVAMTTFGGIPSTIFRSYGWDATSSALTGDGTNKAVWSYHNRSVAGGDFSFSVAAQNDFYNPMLYGYEVVVSGTSVPTADVTITAHKSSKLGAYGNDTVLVSFNVLSADYLVAVVQRTSSHLGDLANQSIGVASYGGVDLVWHPDFHITGDDSSISGAAFGVTDCAILPAPPTGTQNFSITGFRGNFGYNTLHLVGVSSTSGVIGVRSLHGEGSTQFDLALSASATGSLMLGFFSGQTPISTSVTPSYGWVTLEHQVEPTFQNSYLLSSIGASTRNLILQSSGFTGANVLVLEWKRTLNATPAATMTAAVSEHKATNALGGSVITSATPTGQEMHIYWESWLDIPPNKDPSLYVPDDFQLSRTPAYIGMMCLSFIFPRCRYTGMLMTAAQFEEGTGLNFPGTPYQFKAVLDLLRSRCPNMKIVVAVQQHITSDSTNNPYDPLGWGGVTAANLAALNLFIRDFALDGIIMDYEVIDSKDAESDLDHHCQTVNGARVCWTDTEQLAVIKQFRAALPRPLIIILDAIHVGIFGNQPYPFEPPFGWNSGYNLCLLNDAAALACLDGIHIMSYDAGDTYDPRRALRAFQHYFPSGPPLYIGLRVGPVDFGGTKQTEAQIIDYATSIVVTGCAGVLMYSMMWDQPSGGGPWYNYGPTTPDGNIAMAATAKVFGLDTGDVPRLNNRRGLEAPMFLLLG